MSINRVIIFTIVANFIVFGHIQAADANDITAEQLLGKWYTLALISNKTNLDKLACTRLTMTKGDNDQSNNIVVRTMFKGEPKEITATAKIENAGMHITYSTIPDVTHLELVTNHNNGEELIFYEKATPPQYELHSRFLVPSEEIKKILEEKATSSGMQLAYIDQSNCS